MIVQVTHEEAARLIVDALNWNERSPMRAHIWSKGNVLRVYVQRLCSGKRSTAAGFLWFDRRNRLRRGSLIDNEFAMANRFPIVSTGRDLVEQLALSALVGVRVAD